MRRLLPWLPLLLIVATVATVVLMHPRSAPPAPAAVAVRARAAVEPAPRPHTGPPARPAPLARTTVAPLPDIAAEAEAVGEPAAPVLPDPADPFSEAQLVAMAETSPTADGRWTRTRVVRTSMRWPLVRIEERLTGDRRGARVLDRVEMVADHLLVRISREQRADALATLVAPLGGSVRRLLPASRLALIAFDGNDLDAMPRLRAALATIGLEAEPDFIVHGAGLPSTLPATDAGPRADIPAVGGFDPSDPDFPRQWALANRGQTGGTPGADIDATKAWASGAGDRTLLVALLDGGVDPDHGDLIANLARNPGESGLAADGSDRATNGLDDDGNGLVDDVVGWDFANDDARPDDDEGHGTHVAGIIGATGGNGLGVIGVCPEVGLLPLKVLDQRGAGTTSDAIAALDYAIARGARVCTAAWGGAGCSQLLAGAILRAGETGILVIAAAGNAAVDNDLADDSAAFYPASHALDNVISVAASDHRDRLAAFTNTGLRSVHLAAPGVAILSTARGGGTAVLSGTSMAAAHVAGACALIAALEPALAGAQIRARVLGFLDHRPELTGRVASGGRLNVNHALRQLAPASVAALPPRRPAAP